mmetsp:Transcript_15850/g.37869  ORF Transcript_15850/g.37869 Transcript_15850/m.37869 type:complete len:313 (-) Transcript_15850:340-1278(-)
MYHMSVSPLFAISMPLAMTMMAGGSSGITCSDKHRWVAATPSKLTMSTHTTTIPSWSAHGVQVMVMDASCPGPVPLPRTVDSVIPSGILPTVYPTYEVIPCAWKPSISMVKGNPGRACFKLLKAVTVGPENSGRGTVAAVTFTIKSTGTRSPCCLSRACASTCTRPAVAVVRTVTVPVTSSATDACASQPAVPPSSHIGAAAERGSSEVMSLKEEGATEETRVKTTGRVTMRWLLDARRRSTSMTISKLPSPAFWIPSTRQHPLKVTTHGVPRMDGVGYVLVKTCSPKNQSSASEYAMMRTSVRYSWVSSPK